jgi:hypothetical protein
MGRAEDFRVISSKSLTNISGIMRLIKDVISSLRFLKIYSVTLDKTHLVSYIFIEKNSKIRD